MLPVERCKELEVPAGFDELPIVLDNSHQPLKEQLSLAGLTPIKGNALCIFPHPHKAISAVQPAVNIMANPHKSRPSIVRQGRSRQAAANHGQSATQCHQNLGLTWFGVLQQHCQDADIGTSIQKLRQPSMHQVHCAMAFMLKHRGRNEAPE